MKISSRKIAITALLCGIIAVLSFTPLGFIPIIPGIIDMAFIYLVVVIVAVQLEGLWVGVTCSTFFGICSLINSYVFPTKILAFCFQNPLISIIPRICIGVTVYFSFKLFTKLFGKAKNKFVRDFLPSGISAVIGIITNSGLVLGFISLGYGAVFIEGLGTTLINFITSVILAINFPIELVSNAIIVPLVYIAVKKATKKGKGV